MSTISPPSCTFPPLSASATSIFPAIGAAHAHMCIWLTARGVGSLHLLGAATLRPWGENPVAYCLRHFAGACTAPVTTHPQPQVISRKELKMDTQPITGETLSWSPYTYPLTDDSACGLTNQEPAGKPIGGNPVGVPAASCPIDLNAVPPASGKHSRDRPPLLLIG